MILIRRLSGLGAALALITAITAVQMSLIAFGNITDYATNHEFVAHVFAMDTTFQSPNVMWRAITDPNLVTAAYLLIIAWETIAAIVLIAATAAWIRGAATGRGTEAARSLSSIGWLMWIALFGGGFIAIGGEWFQMWQSSDWNGLDAALQNVIIASIPLILAHLPRYSAERQE